MINDLLGPLLRLAGLLVCSFIIACFVYCLERSMRTLRRYLTVKSRRRRKVILKENEIYFEFKGGFNAREIISILRLAEKKKGINKITIEVEPAMERFPQEIDLDQK